MKRRCSLKSKLARPYDVGGDARWRQVSLSHTPCHLHTLLALIMLSLLISLPWSAKREKLGSTQLIHHAITNVLVYLLKEKLKQWPNLNLDYFLHASTHILEMSLVHVNKVKNPWLTWSSCERPMWIFFIMLLVIWPRDGLELVDAFRLRLVRVTSSPPPWRGFTLKSQWPSSSSKVPTKGSKSVILKVGCTPYFAERSNW